MRSQSLETQPRRWLTTVLLILILFAGFILRVWHVDWADGHLPHPDERSTIAFYAPTIHWPPKGVNLLDKRHSPLNPLWDVEHQQRRSYTYGHFPLYLLVLTANAAHKLAPIAERLGAPTDLVKTLDEANGVPGFAIVGRVIMAVADTVTVFLVYLLTVSIYGRRRGRKWAGLLAAAFSAFTVLQIQLSHFFAVDPISTTFTVLALYGALRMTETRAGHWAVLTGVGAGLAIASKFSALPILAAPVVAGALIWWQGRAGGQDTGRSRNFIWQPARRRQQVTRSGSSSSLALATGLVLLALLVAAATFAVTSPFAILDWENFRQAVLVEQGAMVRGDADFPFTRQYRGTPPYLYHIYQHTRWGMGWPLGILAFAGLAWVLVKALLRKASPGELIILSWIVPYFGLTGLFLAKFMRYMVPVVPLLLVFGAGLVTAIARSNRRPGDQGAGEATSALGGQMGALSAEGATDAASGASYALVVIQQTRRSRRYVLRNWLAGAIAVIALAGALFWSLAYVNGVYNNIHPWIKASRWIYANVPDGSVIAWEQWDDSLPYDLPEPNSYRGRYHYIDWGPFEEDTAQKFELLKQTLRQADYLVLASNRIYGAVDNLPERYPMTNRYYRLLFQGALGYELAHTEVNHPRLLGLEINDEKADESFTLYDHPKVLIFRKVRDLSDEEWDRLLGGSWEGVKAWYVGKPTLLSRVWAWFQREGRAAAPREPEPGEGPDLLLDRPPAKLPVIEDFRWNSLASHSVPLAVLVWWLAITIVGLAAWPIAFVLFRNLRDRGYLFSRSLGWLLVGYVVWLAASLRLGQNALWMIWLAIVLMALISLALGWRRRQEMAAFLRAHYRLLLFGEGLFAVAFLFFVILRLFNPDLWQPWNGGEKFMEFAFLNAILRSAHFPPLDPYFAGGTINYYYYGLYLVGLLIKLTGIKPSVAFNLAIPTLFALTVVNVFALGYSLAGPLSSRGRGWLRPRWLWHGAGSGLLAAFFVALLGNLAGGVQVLHDLANLSASTFRSNLPGLETLVRAADGLVRVMGSAVLPGYRYWDPSRVIPYTINEFPYWSFLFADLHPHMIGIPFTVLFLALAYELLSRPEQGGSVRARAGRISSSALVVGRYGLRSALASLLGRVSGDGLFAVLALVLGGLAVINTWDLPTYFGVAVLAWLLREWRSGRLAARPWPALLRTAFFAAGLLLISVALYLPFFQHYEPLASSGVGLVRTRTELGQWLNIWGFLGFMVVTYLVVELRRRPLPKRARDPGLLRWLGLAAEHWPQLPRVLQLTGEWQVAGSAGLGLAVALAVSALLWLLGFKVPAVLLWPLLGAALLLWRRSVSAEDSFITMLAFTGLLVLMGVEFFYLRDHLQGGEYRRMNTLFKFYIQVWVMLGLVAGVALPRVWGACAVWSEGVPGQRLRWHMGWRMAWSLGFVYLLFLSLIFPILGTPARLNDRFPVQNGRPPIGTLDGMAYMQYGTYTWHPDPEQAPRTPIVLSYDYEAIQWLLDHVHGTPVVAEAVIGYYREGGLRVASFTGFPTLLGFHQEGEQRYGWQTGPRRAKAEEFWNTTDLARTRELLRDLQINYIYVGQLERIMYAPASLAKFDRLVETGELEVVYSNEQVVIYHVLP